MNVHLMKMSDDFLSVKSRGRAKYVCTVFVGLNSEYVT